MQVKIASAVKKDGKLLSVTLQLQEPSEIGIYKKFLADEPAMQKCPHCGKSNKIGKDDLLIRIDNPLTDTLGLHMGNPIVTCDHCKQTIPVSILDYSAFPSVMEFLKALRARYNQKKAGVKG